VELPSQFLENWCWQREALDLIAAHHESGDPLPGDLFKRLSAARCFQSARAMLRQLEFSIFDLRLHSRFDPAGEQTIQQVLDDVRASLSVAESPTYNRFQHAFSHIFAGGYAAGYYGYLWAEVLSADAFGAFEESGIFDSATGQAFLNEVLEKGGVESPLDLFTAFRGRAPGIDALLHQSGLV
jgi:oligopeptidase A